MFVKQCFYIQKDSIFHVRCTQWSKLYNADITRIALCNKKTSKVYFQGSVHWRLHFTLVKRKHKSRSICFKAWDIQESNLFQVVYLAVRSHLFIRADRALDFPFLKCPYMYRKINYFRSCEKIEHLPVSRMRLNQEVYHHTHQCLSKPTSWFCIWFCPCSIYSFSVCFFFFSFSYISQDCAPTLGQHCSRVLWMKPCH